MPEPLPIGDFTANFDPNPMVRLHGRGPEETKCKACRHMVSVFYSRRYWKCDRHSLSKSAASDHRLKWNACRLYEEEAADAPR